MLVSMKDDISSKEDLEVKSKFMFRASSCKTLQKPPKTALVIPKFTPIVADKIKVKTKHKIHEGSFNETVLGFFDRIDRQTKALHNSLRDAVEESDGKHEDMFKGIKILEMEKTG